MLYKNHGESIWLQSWQVNHLRINANDALVACIAVQNLLTFCIKKNRIKKRVNLIKLETDSKNAMR